MGPVGGNRNTIAEFRKIVGVEPRTDRTGPIQSPPVHIPNHTRYAWANSFAFDGSEGYGCFQTGTTRLSSLINH